MISLLPWRAFRVFWALLACAAVAADRPNIIFILADDLGYGELSATGQSRYRTPNIDRLASEGMAFTQAYAGSPICAPSRNTLMTGHHTGHATIRNNFAGGGNAGDRVALRDSDVTIAERLRTAGYATALIGKWGLGEPETPSAPWLRGWDFFFGFVNQKQAHNHYPEFIYRNAVPGPLVANFAHGEAVFANDRFTEEALAWLAGRDATPFFLYLSYTTPHADLKVPEDSIAEVTAAYEWAREPGVKDSSLIFAAMVHRLDRDVGRLLDRLQERGLARNTVVIFTSDNGAHQEDGKDNAFFTASGPFRGLKRDLYEGGIRVPFFVRWPERIAPGSRSDHLLAFWDFSATALELAGASRPADLPDEGVSFAPTLRESGVGQLSHSHLYWEILIKNQARQAVREGRWKALRYGLKSPVQLYDLETDSGERNNLASQHPEIVARMVSRFESSRIDSPEFPLNFPSTKTARP